MKMFNNCIDSAKPYKKSEQGKSFALSLKDGMVCEMVDIEKCVFRGVDFKRCDWLFLIDRKKEVNGHLHTSKALFVELKGENHSSACEQLYHAIDKTKSEIPNFDIEAKIISDKGAQPNLLSQNAYFKKVKRLIRKDIIVHKVHRGNNFTHTETIH